MMLKNKIYIDGLGLVEGHFSGVGQYILGIIRGLDQIIEDAKYNKLDYPEVYIFIPRNSVEKFKSFNFKHIYYKTLPCSFRMMSFLWYRNLMFPVDLFLGKGKYIFPRFVDMRLSFNKSDELVVFDLSYELYKQFSDDKNAEFLSREVRRSINNSKKVIAISKNARKEIIGFYKLDPKKVVVATPAVDPTLFYRRSDEEIDRVKRKYEIKGDYILALSNLEPRKNLKSLIDAYCLLPREFTSKVGLLLVGVNGWKTDKLFEHIIEKVNKGYNIMRPFEFVTDKDKPAIISGAKMLVYPSHYEGFGMPPLEALACGTPVITSDNSSLPEVVGNVGVMVPSNNVDLLTKEMLSYLRNIDNITKKTIIDGPTQAYKFSWKESAKIFLDNLESK